MHFICWMSAIFLLPVCLTYWRRKYTTRVDPHVDNSHLVWFDMIINCRVIAFLSADTSCDLVTLTFDLEQMSYMASHVINLATKYDDPTPVRSSVISYNVYRWLIWKCVRHHCACAESRDPPVGGQKQLHFWNARPRFAYSLCNSGGSTMKVLKVICENNARPCVKTLWDSAHARNHVIC